MSAGAPSRASTGVRGLAAYFSQDDVSPPRLAITAMSHSASKLTPPERAAARTAKHLGPLRALLVGIDRYEPRAGFPRLRKCANDATEVESALLDTPQLNAQQDRTTLITSATTHRLPSRGVIIDQVGRLADGAEDGDRLLFYFSGHGHRIADVDDHFLVPQDVYSESEPDALISVKALIGRLRSSAAKQVLIVLDACMSGPAELGKKLGAHSFSPKFFNDYLVSTTGFAIVSSSAADEASFEKSPNPKLSLFTHHLVQALRGAPGALDEQLLTLGSLFKFVNLHVRRDAKSHGVQQTPSLNETANGVMVLADFRAPAAAPPAVIDLAARGVTHLVVRDSDRVFTKSILQSWRDRRWSMDQLQHAANRPETLAAYLADDVAELRTVLRRDFGFGASSIEADFTVLRFPGGSLEFAFENETKDRGRLWRTLTLDSDWFANAPRLEQLLKALGLYRPMVKLHFQPSITPLDRVSVLEAHGWKTRQEAEDEILVARDRITVRLSEDTVELDGVPAAKLLDASNRDERATVAAQALQLVLRRR